MRLKLCGLIFAFFCLPFYFCRVPYLHQLAVNEENVFLLASKLANMGNPFSPIVPIGVCEGQLIRIDSFHPPTHFAFFHSYGRILKFLGVESFSPDFTFFLRFFQLALIACSISYFIYRYFRLDKRAKSGEIILFCLGTAALFSSAFFTGASMQLQWDGVIAAFPILLLISEYLGEGESIAQNLRVLFFAFLVGCDKPERLAIWIFCRLFSIVAAPILWKQKPRYRKVYAYEFAGYILGVVLLSLADFPNWLHSLGIAHIVMVTTNSSWAEYLRFLKLFFKWTYFVPALVGGALFVRSLYRSKFRDNTPFSPRELSFVTVYCFAVAIFSTALMTRRIGDGFPRYFGPVMFSTVLVSWISVREDIVQIKGISVRFLAPALAVFLAVAGYCNWSDLQLYRGRSITSVFSQVLPVAIQCPEASAKRDCLLKIPYECVKENYTENFVLGENAPAMGEQCKQLRFCQ